MGLKFQSYLDLKEFPNLKSFQLFSTNFHRGNPWDIHWISDLIHVFIWLFLMRLPWLFCNFRQVLLYKCKEFRMPAYEQGGGVGVGVRGAFIDFKCSRSCFLHSWIISGIVDAFKRQPSFLLDICHILGSPNLGGKVDSLPGRQADYLWWGAADGHGGDIDVFYVMILLM